LWEAIDGSPVPKHLLGDARRVSNIMYAIWDAYEVASKI
jgi:2-enoate reductase